MTDGVKTPAFPEIEHAYGPQVHLLADPLLSLGLSILSSPDCRQPQLHHWIGRLYQGLLQAAVNHCFSQEKLRTPTRMVTLHPTEGVAEALVPSPTAKSVVVALARAGTVPSHVCFDELNWFFNPENVRQDHLMMNRSTDEEGHVTGAQNYGAKIGGDITDRYVFIPDPMGATGSTILQTLGQYRDRGTAKKWIALHLIVTPEYLRALRQRAPNVEIFALRLDRGLSTTAALREIPGRLWEEEKGLNEKQYIVPGAGGLGEILNNAFI